MEKLKSTHVYAFALVNVHVKTFCEENTCHQLGFIVRKVSVK